MKWERHDRNPLGGGHGRCRNGGICAGLDQESGRFLFLFTFIIDGEGLFLVEDLVAADVAVFGRTVAISSFDLDDFVFGTTLVDVDHVTRLVKFRVVLVDVVDADPYGGTALDTKERRRQSKPVASGAPISRQLMNRVLAVSVER